MSENQIDEFLGFADRLDKWLCSHDYPYREYSDSRKEGEYRKAYSALEALVLKALNVKAKKLGGRTFELKSSFFFDGYSWYLGRENLFSSEYMDIDHIYDIFRREPTGCYYTAWQVDTKSARYARAVMLGDVGWEWQMMSLSLCFEHGYDYDPALFEPGSMLTEKKAKELAKSFVTFLQRIIEAAYDYAGEDDGRPISDEELEMIDEDEFCLTPDLYRKNCIRNEATPGEVTDELMRFIDENEADVPPALFFQECLFDAYGTGYEGMLLYKTNVYASRTLGYIVGTYLKHPEIHTKDLDRYVGIIRRGGSLYSYTCLAGDTLLTITETGRETGCMETNEGEREYYDAEHVHPDYIACRMIEEPVAEYIRKEVEKKCSKICRRSRAS